MAVKASEVVRFGPFSLYRTSRVLLEHGQPVRLGSRALDILLLLVERGGEFVSNSEISRRVWPRTAVVDGNLRVVSMRPDAVSVASAARSTASR